MSSAFHVFLFAHPDDEFGCFESIRRVASCGDHAVCVYLTDGGYGGQPVEPRMRESRTVLCTLGVSPQDIHFVGVASNIPDGRLPEYMDRALQKLFDVMQRYPLLADIYAPAWEGGHQDHDAAHLLGLALALEKNLTGGVWQFSLYNGKGLRGSWFRVMHALPENGSVIVQRLSIRHRLHFMHLCLQYPSQWKTWLGLLPFVAGTLLLRGSYELQRAPLPPSGCRPHAGALLYERRGAMSWDDFVHYCDKFMPK